MAEVSAGSQVQRDEDVQRQRHDPEALLRVARSRWTQGTEADGDYRRAALEAQRFKVGWQWDPYVENLRRQENRPCLTINRCRQFVNQITNNQRMNRPRPKVSAVDDKGDPDTAQVIQGLLRHIWENSDADLALDTANEAAATHGRGFYRVLLDYEEPMSFDLTINVARIRNALAVVPDPVAQDPTGADLRWCFVVDTLQRDEFLQMYPADIEGDPITAPQLDTWGQSGDGWCLKDTVRVAEYFWREDVRAEIAEVVTMQPDGSLSIGIERVDALPQPLPETMQILRQRVTMLPVVWWAKINGYAVLDLQRWPGRWIPIVQVTGEETAVGEKVVYSGIVDALKDAQRQYNLWSSAITEAIAVAPRAPWVLAAGQQEGFEQLWATANTEPHAYLPYMPVSLDGSLAPPPQRNVAEPAIQAMTQALMLASEDMKATTGIYDASLGARSNETAGIAIQQRQSQGDMANFHFPDNSSRSIKHLGRILLDLLPHAFPDEGRIARIIGEDDTEDQVRLNQPYEQNGVQKLFDVRVGKYDVRMEAGPSFATRRQEAAASMADLVQRAPQLMSVAGDLLVKNFDWPGADELAARLKKTLPPQLLDEEAGDPEQQAAQMAAQVQQQQQQLEQLNAYAQQAEAQIQQLTEENAALKRSEAVKQQQLVLQSREVDLAHQAKMRELELKAEELDREYQLKQEELALKAETNDMQALKIRLDHLEAQQALQVQNARAEEGNNET